MNETMEPQSVSEETNEPLSESELCPPELLKGQEEAYERDIVRLRARTAEFVSVNCPACRSGGKTFAFEKFGFEYALCEDCGAIYMTPRPTPLIMAEYYANSENYRYWAEHIFPASEGVRRKKIHEPWLARVAGYCQKYDIARGTLIEVGAGFGIFCDLVRERGLFRRVVAVEPNPDLAACCARRGLEVASKSIEDVGDALPPADVVVSFEVLEHLFDPSIFMEKCAGILKPGGLLVLSCPNGEGFDIATLGPKALAVDTEHVNFFNPHSLSILVESHGFEVLEVSTPGRLDAEFVREAALRGETNLERQPFLKRVLLDEWDRFGWPFQVFLAENGLSSHMWMAARKRQEG